MYFFITCMMADIYQQDPATTNGNKHLVLEHATSCSKCCDIDTPGISRCDWLVNGYIGCHLAFQRLQRVQSRTKLFALYTKLFPMSSGSLVKTKFKKVVGRIVRGRMFDSQQYTTRPSRFPSTQHTNAQHTNAAHKRTAHKRSTQKDHEILLFVCLSFFVQYSYCHIAYCIAVNEW